ncbi:MAG: indole-3-glycerol phosphate synthase TrpC [Chloroflexota bacterium]|nr:indole-3-glycerol phosphate synthase TrpC [Chloroflexota bacterium]
MILDEIVAAKQEELARSKRLTPLSELEAAAAQQRPPLDLASAIRGDGIRLIAEVKRASPSKGLISPDLDPARLALTYASNGAAAISVLTEEPHFHGTLEDLRRVRGALPGPGVPLLRKDFIFDPYQVYQSRACGADALLLIVAILSREQLGELLALSHSLGMHCLVEAHMETEVEVAVASGARVVGINNRDLTTFAVDLATTERLRALVPPERLVVSESGIGKREDVDRLRHCGVDAILVGEALAASDDVPAAMRELL